MKSQTSIIGKFICIYVYFKKCSDIMLIVDLTKLYSDLQGLKCWRTIMKLKRV